MMTRLPRTFVNCHRFALSQLLLALLWCGGCSKAKEQPEPTVTQLPDNLVAIVGNEPILLETFQAGLRRRFPRERETGLTIEQKQAVLDALVCNEALYAKAKAAGFDQSPEIQARIKNLIVTQFKEQQFQPANVMVSELEIEAFYQANPERYAQPGAVRGAVIVLPAPAAATAEKQAEFLAQAEAVLREARDATNEQAFAQVVRRHSEDQSSRYRSGDIGWFGRSDAGADAALVEALFSVETPGTFAPLVRTPRGFYIARLLEKREAGLKPLSEVSDAIRYQLTRQKTERAEAEFQAAMKQGLDIQINNPLLEAISIPVPKDEPPRLPGTRTAQVSQRSHP